MSNEMSRDEIAIRREVRSLRGFYHHLTIFLLVNGALAAFNLFARPDKLWFTHVTLGWSIALLIHGFRALILRRHFGAAWEEARVKAALADKR